MNTSKNEQDFVFRYFQSGKLNTQEALRKVKARASVGTTERHMNFGRIKEGKASFRWLAVAASVAVLLVVGAYTLLQPKMVELKSADQIAVYQLPDGTKVTLSPFSSLSYQENNCRKVEMKGRVYYQVKHDEVHPFDVTGEHGHVRVLGTQFMVDERTENPVVMVTSGKVLFAARDSKEGVFLTRGKQARLLAGSDKPELMSEFDANDVAWATHRLHFENTPLEEVLDELGQLSGKKYVASDESKRLTGDFETDSIPEVIHVIEETLGVTILQK